MAKEFKSRYKKGVFDSCKRGKWAVEYENKTAKAHRKLVLSKEDSFDFATKLMKQKHIGRIARYKC